MRWATLILCSALVFTAPARADGSRLEWPLRPSSTVVRDFDAPSPDWRPGHRGVDLAGAPGQAVYATGSATVAYAGSLAGRPVISLAHPGGLYTSYEPVSATVQAGQLVTAKTMIGGAPRLPGHRVLALGSAVGPGVSRPLPRPAGAAGLHPDTAQAARRLASVKTTCRVAPSEGESGPRMGLIVHRPQPRNRNMSVELRGGQAGMTEQLLDNPQVGTAFKEMGSRAVSQSVWPHVGCAVDGGHGLVHHGAGLPYVEPPATCPEQQAPVRTPR